MDAPKTDLDVSTYRGAYIVKAWINGEHGSILSLNFTGEDTAEAALKTIRDMLKLPIAFSHAGSVQPVTEVINK